MYGCQIGGDFASHMPVSVSLIIPFPSSSCNGSLAEISLRQFFAFVTILVSPVFFLLGRNSQVN